MTDKLDQLLAGLGISSPWSRQLFREHATLTALQKGTDVFVEGKRNNCEYLLLSGVLHRYNVSEKGDMVATGFYLSGSVIMPHFARTSKGKSLFSLQASTDVVLAAIPVSTLDQLRADHTDFHEFGQRVVERELAAAVQLEIIFRSFNAKERLLALRKQYPNLENLVPHHLIASFLGVTHVSFSRLRRELSQTGSGADR